MRKTKKSVLLIVSGGIAAYKIPDLIRVLRQNAVDVTCIMTKAAEAFVTPLTLATLSENPVYTNLLNLKDETEIGHIQLSRQSDLVVVAPATANIIAKMAHGITDNLATTCLLATDKPVLVAPAMNGKMWDNAATQRNIKQLQQDGIPITGPEHGLMACGETGYGRMSSIETLCTTILTQLKKPSLQTDAQTSPKPLQGRSVLITAGPTHEDIDPVRYIANHSSGKQGYALAQQASLMGADVTLISGPTQLPPPIGIKTVQVRSASEMLYAANAALPVDIAICAAAVADWRIGNPVSQKLKKETGTDELILTFRQNPDILHSLSTHPKNRPSLVVGFAAETQNVLENAIAKRKRKQCDIIIANDVSKSTGTFGGDHNQVYYITATHSEKWEKMSKKELAQKLLTSFSHHNNLK